MCDYWTKAKETIFKSKFQFAYEFSGILLEVAIDFGIDLIVLGRSPDREFN